MTLHTRAADMLERYGRVDGVMHCEVSMLIAELREVETQIKRQSAGNARYEYLRTMTPIQYTMFHAEWMRSGKRYDAYVDELVADRRAIVANAIKGRT